MVSCDCNTRWYDILEPRTLSSRPRAPSLAVRMTLIKNSFALKFALQRCSAVSNAVVMASNVIPSVLMPAYQPMPTTREYQQEMFDRSMKGNVIVAMDTGSGKTHMFKPPSFWVSLAN